MPTPIDRWRRRLASLAYLCFAAAGVGNIFDLSRTFAGAATPTYVVVWIVFLIGGGLVGALGATSRRPTPELSGIVALAAAILVYEAAVIAVSPWNGGKVIVITLFGALLLLLSLRALDLLRAQWVQERVDHRGGPQ